MKKRILVVFGTRPEYIKLAPLVRALRDSGSFEVYFYFTHQHDRDVLDPFFREFSIYPDNNANFHFSCHDLTIQTCELSATVAGFLESGPHFDLLIVQGDTASAFGAALAGFNAKIPIAHVEAGLRSDHLDNPFPEEGYRRMIDTISTYRFCPTMGAFKNCMNESGTNYRVGNTIVDSIDMFREHIQTPKSAFPYVLVTLHRRESWNDEHVREITAGIVALRKLAPPQMQFFYIRHPNKELAHRIANILVIHGMQVLSPQKYSDNLNLIAHARLVITDSGGILEECTALGVPCTVVRDFTERQEAFFVSGNSLVGRSREGLLTKEVTQWVSAGAQEHMRFPSDLYGTPGVCRRIVEILRHEL